MNYPNIRNPFFRCVRFISLLLGLCAGTVHAEWEWLGLSSVHALDKTGGYLLVGADNGAFKSGDSGETWTPINKGLDGNSVIALTVSGSNIFAGTQSGAYLSTDTGANWKAIDSGLTPDSAVFAFLVAGNHVFAGTPTGVYRSDTTGAVWTAANTGLPVDRQVYALIAKGGILFAGTQVGEIFMSEDYGATWKTAGGKISILGVQDFAVAGEVLFAAVGNKVAFSNNNGTSWSYSTSRPASDEIYRLIVEGATLFAATDAGVYFSGDNAMSWKPFNTGLVNLDVRALSAHGGNLFAASVGGVWRRPLSEVPAAMLPGIRAKPESGFITDLSKPLGPDAEIKFSIPHSGMVDLEIQDMRGCKILTLIHSHLEAGTHQAALTGAGMTAGPFALLLRSREAIRIQRFLFMK